MLRNTVAAAAVAVLAARGGIDDASSRAESDLPFAVEDVAQFEEPWAMVFLPDGRLLVTEQKGSLKVLDLERRKQHEIEGVPRVEYGGQGGLGDVALHPDFESNDLVYLTYAEAGENNTRGAALARAKLTLDGNDGGQLSDVEVIWRQVPKVAGQGHYGHRILFGPDGYLWVSSGERQKFDPAQDLQANLGKILRLRDDGSVPDDNPFAEQGGVSAEIWSLGHRNPLGIAFDAQGRLWNIEMGPKGGDELNLIERGANYGYPMVSNGDHYDGRPIPDSATRPEFHEPAVTWSPVISPGGFIIYSGTEFPDWQGDGLIAGLSSKSLVRVEFNGEQAHEAAHYPMGQRIRAVKQGPDGAVWLLEDGKEPDAGRLLRLSAPGD